MEKKGRHCHWGPRSSTWVLPLIPCHFEESAVSTFYMILLLLNNPPTLALVDTTSLHIPTTLLPPPPWPCLLLPPSFHSHRTRIPFQFQTSHRSNPVTYLSSNTSNASEPIIKLLTSPTHFRATLSLPRPPSSLSRPSSGAWRRSFAPCRSRWSG